MHHIWYTNGMNIKVDASLQEVDPTQAHTLLQYMFLYSYDNGTMGLQKPRNFHHTSEINRLNG